MIGIPYTKGHEDISNCKPSYKDKGRIFFNGTGNYPVFLNTQYTTIDFLSVNLPTQSVHEE